MIGAPIIVRIIFWQIVVYIDHLPGCDILDAHCEPCLLKICCKVFILITLQELISMTFGYETNEGFKAHRTVAIHATVCIDGWVIQKNRSGPAGIEIGLPDRIYWGPL